MWRDVKLRYKQTAIGIAWVILQPLLTMIMFSLVFGRLAKIPSDGLPYPVFVYSALLPWTLFASSLWPEWRQCCRKCESHLEDLFPAAHSPDGGDLPPLLDFLVRLCHPDRDDGVVRHHSELGTPVAAAVHLGSGLDGAFGRLVACRPERAIPGRRPRDSVLGSAVDVRLAGCVSGQHDSRPVALSLQSESDGGSHRWISLGPARNARGQISA